MEVVPGSWTSCSALAGVFVQEQVDSEHIPTLLLSGAPWQLHPQQPYLSHVQVGPTVTHEGPSVLLAALSPFLQVHQALFQGACGMGVWLI